MRRIIWLLLICPVIIGCEVTNPKPQPRTETEQEMFGPSAMRLHPVFTQVKDWTGEGKPDGIEVMLEFQDQFADPTKASGKVVFELFEFQKLSPDPRGKRLVNPWIGDLTTIEEQRARWNRTSRTYSFQLVYPQISPRRAYVLTATFDLASGGRFFDRLVIGAKPEEPGSATPPNSPPPRQPEQP